MNTLTGPAFAVFALVLTAAFGNPAEANPKDEAQIRSLVERWRLAFQQKDVGAVMSIYAHGKTTVAYDIVPPLQYVGYDAYKKDYEEFFSQFSSPLKVELKDVHIAADGSVGYLFALEHLSGTMKTGEKTDLWLRATEIYRKENGRWVAVHDHISVPADLATGKAVLDLKP